MNSKQLWNKRTALVDAMNEAAKDNMDEAHRIEGEIRALDVMIEQVVDEEDAARAAASSHLVKSENVTLGERLFGAKAQFEGIQPGFKTTVPVRDAIEGLGTPQIYRRDLPGAVALPSGFLATLPKGTTDGDEHFFMTPSFTNNAAGWTTGDKPESGLGWEEDVAHIETIAHWMPIKKQTANRYSQLESIVSSTLMLGLDMKADALALRGNSASGIVGVLNNQNIINHTISGPSAGKNLRDEIYTMARKVRVNSGIAPNYVCLSPYAIELLAQKKDDEGRYLFEDIRPGGNIGGMTIVEDVNMLYDGEVDMESALVYYSGGASFDIADPAEVTIGLVNNQFIQNEYTLLAEITAALMVHMPSAFCYCAEFAPAEA